MNQNSIMGEKLRESGASSESGVGLLQMPDLVVNKILQLLSTSDILTLRLICRSAKLWVESICPDKMCIQIGSMKAFRTILYSSTIWTNFLFLSELCPNRSQVSRFSQLYSEHIHTLHFTSVLNPLMISIISSCTSLKVLVIEELDGLIFEKLSSKKKLNFSRACSTLEHLGIQELRSNDNRSSRFFIKYTLLASCSSLKSLVIPFLTFPTNCAYQKTFTSENWAPGTTMTDVLVVRPVIEILDDKSKTPNLESIIVVPQSRNQLSDSALFCLTLLCYHRRINLVYDTFNEANYNLGKLKYSLSYEPSMQMSEIASKIMTVMASTTDLLLSYEFTNLRKLVVQFCTFHIEDDIFAVHNFPRLQTLSMDFKTRQNCSPGCSKVKRMDMFVQGMLDTVRPTVKRVSLHNHSCVKSVVVLNTTKLANCFVNLRCLTITNYGGDAKDFVTIWKGLRLLEAIELEGCLGLNDKAILGENWTKPAILDLTDLRVLKITDVGRVTDLSYIIAFKYMRLTKFHHGPLYPSDVTFEGYNSLAEGDFSKTVKFLSGTKTNFGRRTKADLKEYLDNFKFLLTSQKKELLQNFCQRRWFMRFKQ